MRVNNNQFVVTPSRNDLFFRLPRTKTHVKSVAPDEHTVAKLGDYTYVAWTKHFIDGTISLARQQDEYGNVVLSIDDAMQMLKYDNPLRDAIELVKHDGKLELRNGFHRIHEAIARGYKGRVHCIVLDMDLSTDDDASDDD